MHGDAAAAVDDDGDWWHWPMRRPSEQWSSRADRHQSQRTG